VPTEGNLAHAVCGLDRPQVLSRLETKVAQLFEGLDVIRRQPKGGFAVEPGPGDVVLRLAAKARQLYVGAG